MLIKCLKNEKATHDVVLILIYFQNSY